MKESKLPGLDDYFPEIEFPRLTEFFPDLPGKSPLRIWLNKTLLPEMRPEELDEVAVSGMHGRLYVDLIKKSAENHRETIGEIPEDVSFILDKRPDEEKISEAYSILKARDYINLEPEVYKKESYLVPARLTDFEQVSRSKTDTGETTLVYKKEFPTVTAKLIYVIPENVEDKDIPTVGIFVRKILKVCQAFAEFQETMKPIIAVPQICGALGMDYEKIGGKTYKLIDLAFKTLAFGQYIITPKRSGKEKEWECGNFYNKVKKDKKGRYVVSHNSEVFPNLSRRIWDGMTTRYISYRKNLLHETNISIYTYNALDWFAGKQGLPEAEILVSNFVKNVLHLPQKYWKGRKTWQDHMNQAIQKAKEIELIEGYKHIMRGSDNPWKWKLKFTIPSKKLYSAVRENLTQKDQKIMDEMVHHLESMNIFHFEKEKFSFTESMIKSLIIHGSEKVGRIFQKNLDQGFDLGYFWEEIRSLGKEK